MKTLPSELHRWTCHLTKYHNTTVINICLYSLFFLVSEQLLFVSELLLSGFCVFLVSGLSGIVFMLASSGPPSPPQYGRLLLLPLCFFFFLYHRKAENPKNSCCPSSLLFCLSPTLHPCPLCTTTAASRDILSINCSLGITSPRMVSKSPSGQLYIDFRHVLRECLF